MVFDCLALIALTIVAVVFGMQGQIIDSLVPLLAALFIVWHPNFGDPGFIHRL